MNVSFAHSRKALVIAAVVVALGAVTGCHKKEKPVNPASLGPMPSSAPAPTATLTADPEAIDVGQSVVLNWRTQNATSVTIDGIGEVPVNGTQTVTPSSSTNFHLTAKGDGGTTEANVRVTVRVPQAPSANSGEGDMGSEAAFHQNVKDIFFDYDSYDVRPDAQASIPAAASYLNAHPAIKVVIGGYCDERGSAEYNLALGENRANSAKTALVNAGVSGSRIRVISYGKEKQFCTEQNESCWQQNRRAQFSLDR
ncbi:peptidoglycan-associated lipoprotein Pal [Edaphobacter albus]|uniref:peptidoglycan-associated lipoprotein Pal n=1 Tax=Edaphobacter sp. 4G125 TaxID=2763071 RepID=UPI0016461DD7|nr:peptidoglycan-associated lipoprotein Pal [Edaphobacter sp. 4G125]QNI35494.1 peptidoglycan-associated lipoprotein Pal [Edaphobacter sp. 4G125]